MKLSEYKTGMIVRENNDYSLVLGMFDYVIEEAKKDIALYDISAIGRDIEWPLHVYNCGITLLELNDARVDFTKEINVSLIFKAPFQYLNNCKVVKTVKIPEKWVVKNKLLYPDLRGLKTVEDGIKELQQELDKNKYKIAVEKIKKKSTFQKINSVKSNQIVAAKIEQEYKIFLVEDMRVIEFMPYMSLITNLAYIDLSKMPRVSSQLVNAKEYYLLANLKG